MRVLDLLHKRYATRAISSSPLPPEVLADIAEAARLTPSCYNKQPWRFLFITSEAGRAKAVAALSPGNRPWACRAPLLVAACSRAEDDCQLPDGRKYYRFDLGMAVMNLMLAATEHGLAARPMAGFDPVEIRKAFGLADADDLMVVVAVGRPEDGESHLPERYKGLGGKPRERKVVDEIVSWW